MRYCSTERILQRIRQIPRRIKLQIPSSVRSVALLKRKTSENTTCRPTCVNNANRNYSILLVHKDDRHFFIILPGGERAFLEYEETDTIFTILETEVPAAYQGRGVAKILAKTALAYAQKRGLRLRVNCDYVKDFIEKHEPEYRKLLVD